MCFYYKTKYFASFIVLNLENPVENYSVKNRLTFYSLYLYSQALFVVNNIDLFNTNNEFHQYNTRTNKNLHLPSIHLMKYAKGPYVNTIKVYNHLPKNIKNLV